MSKVSARAFELRPVRSSAPKIDKYLIPPILACVYPLIVFPLILVISCADERCLMEDHQENKLFWPAMAIVSLVMAIRHRSRLTIPPNLICLFAYLAFAGVSVLWAFRPEL